MAINSQKLLPLAKSSTAIVKSAGSSISDGKNKGGALIKSKTINVGKLIPYKKEQEEKKDERYGAIIKSLSTISSIIKSDFTSEQKKTQKEDTEKKEEDSKKREENIENKERPKGLSKLSGISLPKFGFLDAVKRYFLFTFLGWLFTNTQQYLPQLLKILDIIKPVAQFAETLFKGLFDGFVTFIDKGYEKYDEVRNFAKNLGGEGAQKVFDDLSKNLNTLIITTILVAGALANLGEKQNPSTSQKPPGPGERVPPKGGASRPGGVPRTSTRRPVPTTSGGRPLGRLDIRNPLREKPRITGSGGGGRAGRLDIRNPLRQKPRITGSSGSNRGLLRVVRPFLKRIPLPVVGALIDFGLSVALGENPGRAAFRAIGAGILGAVGAAIGSVVPVAGNMIGGIAGGMAGDWVGGALYDMFFGGKKPSKGNNGSVQRKASGGKVSPRPSSNTKSAPRRTLKISPKKPPRKPPQISKPGKDVGGEKRIKALYPSNDPMKMKTLEEWLAGDNAGTYQQYVDMVKSGQKKQKVRPSPYKALTSTAKILKQIPLVGGIMGAAVDVALGQKPDVNVYKSISSGIGYLVERLATEKTNMSVSSLQRDIVGMADGGYVPPTRQLRSSYDALSSGDMISKIIGPSIEQRVDEALQNLQKELQKRGKEEKEDGNGGGDLGTGALLNVKSDSPDFWLLVAAAAFENNNPIDGYQGAADVAQAVYNRVSLPGWPKSIRKVILAPSQFAVVSENGGAAEWSQINSKQSAIDIARRKGISAGTIEAVAAALLNQEKQRKAREFVGPRDNFRSVRYEAQNNHLDDFTEVRRYGHVFGFEPGGVNIAAFRRNQLMPAQINERVVRGDVEQSSQQLSGIPYINQRSSSTGPNRECFSASSAMIAASYLGRNISLEQYNRIREKYGDSISSSSQIRALRELGISASVSDTGSIEEVARLVSRGIPVAIGLNHNNASGHWLVVTGVTSNGDFIVNDPFGKLRQVRNTGWEHRNSTSPSDTGGRNIVYRREFLRSIFEDRGSGTGRIMRVEGTPKIRAFQVQSQQTPSSSQTQSSGVASTSSGGRSQLPRNGTQLSSERRYRQPGLNIIIPMNIGAALEKKGAIPFIHRSQTYYLRYDPTIGRPYIRVWKPKIGILPDLGGVNFDVRNSNADLLESAMQKIRSMYKFQGGGPISIAPSKSNRPIPNSYASYENYGSGMMFAIQPVMIKEVAISMPSKTPPLMFPSGNLNNKDTYAYHSLSRG